MRSVSLTLGLFLIVPGLAAAAAHAADKHAADRVMDVSRGDLAFRPGSRDPWRVAHSGELLPANVLLRTSSAGPCRVELRDGTLHLGAETQARVDFAARTIRLSTGTLFLEVSSGEWSVQSESIRAVLGTDARAEFSARGSRHLVGRVIAGEVTVLQDGKDGITISARRGFDWDSQDRTLTATVMSTGEIERLSRWNDTAPPAQGFGELLVEDPQSGSPVRLKVARYHVNVVLHPPVALVQIDQSFFNPYVAQREGTFQFRLPEGASVSRFAMYTTHTQLVEGELIEREKASNIYESIVSRQRDPAILEQIGGSLFKMRVFPIPGSDTKRVLLDYTVPLVPQGKSFYKFALPLMADRDPVWDFAINGAIHGPTIRNTPHCISHPGMTFNTVDDDSIKFAFAQAAYRADTAFEMQFRQEPAKEVTLRSFIADDAAASNDCEFLATINADVLERGGLPALHPEEDYSRQTAVAAPAPADILILADTSGGVRHRQKLRQAVRTIALGLRETDRLRLGCVDVDFRPLTAEWSAPQSDAASRLLETFDHEFPLGESDFLRSFSGALASLPKPEAGRRQFVVYVGDGILPERHAPVATVLQSLRDALARTNVRFCSLLVDNEPDGKELFEQLAAASGGRLFQTSAAGAAPELFAWILSGAPSPARIVAVRAEGVATDDVFHPAAWIPGQPLTIYGRRKGAGELKLHVEFERDGKSGSGDWMLPTRTNASDMFVGRLWAQRKLERLRASMASAATEQDRQLLVQAIVSLSQEWTLLSPYTAFLVLEQEAEYPRYGITRTRRRLYWNPRGAIAAAPLSAEAIEALRRPASAAPPARAPISQEQFEKLVARARTALETHSPDRALSLLKRVAGSPRAADSSEFTAVREAALKALWQIDLLRGLGPQRGWFDRRTAIGFDVPASSLLGDLLYGFNVRRRDEEMPLGVLQKQIVPPAHEMSLDGFVDWLKSASGLNVWMDRATLTDEGVATDQKVPLRGIRLISLHSLMKHVLEPVQLTWVFEDDVLKITTSAKAGEKLNTRLYPISDLVVSDRQTDFTLLVDPEVDRELQARNRMQQKLNRKVSASFLDLPLEDALEYLSEKLDDNLVLDRPTLIDEGVALDQPITLDIRDLSIRQVLTLLCDPVQLTAVVEDEAVKITTQAKAGERLETRLYSARGIVYELPPELLKKRLANRPNAPRHGGRGIGGMGGGGVRMGGMGMGGMGGFSGGGFFGGGGTGGGGIGGGNFGGGAASTPSVSEITDFQANEPDANAAPADKPARDEDLSDPEDEIPSRLRARPVPWLNPETPAPPDDWQPADGTNAEEAIEFVKAAIQPDAWDDLSGPGSMLYFPGSLAFVVRQTAAVHDEVATLLERLREFPAAFGPRSGFAPARILNVNRDDVARWDVRSLTDVVTTFIQPDSWEEFCGPGSIQVFAPKLLLSIRQTDEVHRETRNLLTMLRQARYLAQQGKSWSSFDFTSAPCFSAILGVTNLPSGLRQSDLPEPDDAELRALTVLADVRPGMQTWRSSSADGRRPQTTRIRHQGGRSEFEFDGRLARLEGDGAVVAYPHLALAERGAWGEALRRIVDGRLPWLPHRSHRELAQLFVVQVIDQDDQSVRLQWHLPGATPGNDLLVTVSRRHGLPTQWESRLDGNLALRLRFADLGHVGGKPAWRTVIAEDEAGRTIERWELVDNAEDHVEIPALDAGWGGWQVDLREQEREVVPPPLRALRVIRQRDWETAQRALAEALRNQPHQPLLALFRAWTIAQSPGDHETELVELLKQVAGAAAGDLLQPLADGSFSQLGTGVLYDIMTEQPVERRRPVDWDRLARAAARAGKPYDAIRHLRTAIETPDPADTADQRRLLVELLFETRQGEDAVAMAEFSAALPNARPEDLAALAEILFRYKVTFSAVKLMTAALAHPTATGERRYRLLRRRADLESGRARWFTILEAIDTLPANHPWRARAGEILLAELTDPAQVEVAALLADRVHDQRMKTELRLREAELYALRPNARSAADVAWSVYESGRLSPRRFEWLIGLLRAGNQNRRLIEAVEARLRAGIPVEKRLLDSLADAYEVAGLSLDAKRARTNALDFKPSPSRHQLRRGGL